MALLLLFPAMALLPTMVLAATAADGASRLSLDEQFELFLTWFPGEYDNNEQVWQQVQDGLEGNALHERIHHHFVPVELPAVGDHVFFVIQTMDDDPGLVYRQRIYRFDASAVDEAIRLEIFRMEDEERYRDAWQNPALLGDVTMDSLSARPGYEFYWTH